MSKVIIPVNIKGNEIEVDLNEKEKKLILELKDEKSLVFDIKGKESILKKVQNEKVNGIKLTLNPNDITKENLKKLKSYKVKEITLLIESSNDYILRNIGANYNFEKIKQATKMIKHKFIKLNVLTVIGLPEATLADDLNTIKRISKLKPKELIIIACDKNYNNSINQLYNTNEYEPLSSVQITERLKEVITTAEKLGIKNIKIEERDNIKSNVLESIWYDRIIDKIKSYNVKVKEVTIQANPKDVKNIKGLEDTNLNKLKETYDVVLNIEENEKIKTGQFKMQILETYTDFLEDNE